MAGKAHCSEHQSNKTSAAKVWILKASATRQKQQSQQEFANTEFKLQSRIPSGDYILQIRGEQMSFP